ncbi:MAG: hypothetical protein AAGF95_24255 [Chloroflexota bacterium]
MPPRDTTAAQPLVLLDYAATGTELCARQRQLAAQLAPVLERLLHSCTEYAIGVGEFDLVGRMQRSADTTEHTHDHWLRSVAEAFLAADTGVVTTTAYEMIAALADAPAIKKANIVEELAALETAADRFAYVQNTYPDLITHQNYPTNEKGVNTHIMMDPPASELMLGTRVDYGMNIGDSIHPGDLRIRSFVINDPSLRAAGEAPSIYEGPSRWNWHNAEWTVPGTHLLVYEVTFGDEPPQYYTMEQTIVESTTFAAQRLAEQSPALDAEMYLLSLTMMLEQAEQLEGADPKQIEQLAAALANAEALLAEGGTPLPAVLVTEETSQTLPLNLFVQETAEGFALIDLTNPHPDAARTYRGDTLEAAWADFVENNTLPAGQLAATPPTERESSPDLWNVHSNGRSTLEEWSNGLGIFSAVGMGAGIVLLFVPGGQLAGALILAGSLSLGAVSTGLSMADRAKYGNLTWNTQTQLEVLELLATGFVGTRLVGSGVRMTAKAIGAYGVQLEILEVGTDVTSTFLLSKEYYEQIETIRGDPDLSEDEKEKYIREIAQQAIAMGGLIMIGSSVVNLDSLSAITYQQKIRIDKAIDNAGINPQLAEAIRNSEDLQKVLRTQEYNVTTLQSEWLEWTSLPNSMSKPDFEVWVTDYSLYNVSANDIVDFYNKLDNLEEHSNTSLRRDMFVNYPGFIAHTREDDMLLQKLVYSRDEISNGMSDDSLVKSMGSIVDAAYLAGLDVQSSQQLFLEATGFGSYHVKELGDLAADGTLTKLLRSGFDHQNINLLLDKYDKVSLRAVDRITAENRQPHRAVKAIEFADEIGLRDEVARHVNSGKFQNLPGLTNILEKIQDELKRGQYGTQHQLEEAIRRSRHGNIVAVETSTDPPGKGDVIDITDGEALQMKTLTTKDGMKVADEIRFAASQFDDEVPPAGYKRIIDIQIDNSQNQLVNLDRQQVLYDLQHQYFLKQTHLVNFDVEELWIKTPNDTYMFTPDEFP